MLFLLGLLWAWFALVFVIWFQVNIYNNNNGELRPIGNPPLSGNQVRLSICVHIYTIIYTTLSGWSILWVFCGSSWFARTRVHTYVYLPGNVLLLSYYCRMDDLLVSAPMYSPEINRPEYGIVYVYRNNQVKFMFCTYCPHGSVAVCNCIASS